MRVSRGCGLVARTGGHGTLLLCLLLAHGYLTSVRAGPVEDDASIANPTPSATPTTSPAPDASQENPLHLEGEHVCNHSETQMVRSTQVIMTPVTVQVLTWCISVPPRCVKNTTEMRRKTIEQTVPRTVVVRECCAGYRPEPPESSVTTGPRRCVPDCPLGCEHGECSEPHRCDCAAGYSGLRCDTQCPEGTWGEGCAGNCSCARWGACDASTGACVCAAGWRGSRCEYPCARGFFGVGCAQRCSCAPSCHAVTGACPPSPAPPAAGGEETSSRAPVQPPASSSSASSDEEDASAPGNALDAAHEEESVEDQHPPCEGSACNSGVADSSWEPVQRLTQEPPDAMVTNAPGPVDPDPDVPDPAATAVPDDVDDSDEAVDADGDHTTSYPDPGPHTDPPPAVPVPESVATEAPLPVATTAETLPVPMGPRADKETELQRKKAADAKKQRAKERIRDKLPPRKEIEDGEESSEADNAGSPQLPIELTPAFWPRIPDDESPPPAASNPAAWPHPAAANNIAPDLKPQDLASLKAPAVALPPVSGPAPPPSPADAPGGFSLSRLEVAAGAAVLGAALVGVAALAAARCGGGGGGGGCCGGRLGPKAGRRNVSEVAGPVAGDAVELRALTGRTLAQTDAVAGADDAAALAAVRPLFFSPLYLPATASTPGSELSSPVDAPVGTPGSPAGAANVSATPGAGTGLVLTALFSAPAPAHLQTLCTLQPASEMALLRESLSAHYDVPPTLLRRPTLTGADRRASLPAAAAAVTASNASAGPLATPGAISWAPDPPPTASLYLSPPPPTPTPAALRTSLLSESFSTPTPPMQDHVYEELPCWPRLR